MAHCRLLFVGGRDALQKVYDTADDSSSESKTELTIGADWIADYDWLSEDEKKVGLTTNDFTKESNPELYQEILDNRWWACFDVRDSNYYGDFCCINCPDYETGYWHSREIEKRNNQRTIEAIKKLPDDTLFHFADSHW